MEYVTIREACQLSHASEKRLRNAIISGEIPHVMRPDKTQRMGSWGRFVKHVNIHDLEKWLQKANGVRKKA